MTESAADSLVTVGRIVRPHGNKGHVVVAPETDFAEERFEIGRTLQRRPGGAPPLLIAASREHDGRWVVGFEGVRTIDDAEALRGVELCVPADELHALGPGAFYAHDLAGCVVFLPSGARVGTVARVELGTGVPLLVVTATGSGADVRGEVLVPFTEAICRRVDVMAREIEIDPPEGLIELNRRSHAEP